MKVEIGSSEVGGVVAAPASKSYTIRAILCAALAAGESILLNPLAADDPFAASRVLQQLGAQVTWRRQECLVCGGQLRPCGDALDCGESAATLRFLTALCATIPGHHRLYGRDSLLSRPLQPLLDALRQIGVSCTLQEQASCLSIAGSSLAGGTISLPGHISSQFVSALLFAAPRASKVVHVQLTTPLESRDYVVMTIDCLRRFGIAVERDVDMRQFCVTPQTYRSTCYTVEADWSSAAFLLALGAIAGDVTVRGIERHSLQCDRQILDLLARMGAQVIWEDRGIRVCRGVLGAISADLCECIDLLPIMAVVAAVAQGESRLTGIGRARFKECDRVAAVGDNLARMGVATRLVGEELHIIGGRPHGAVLDCRGDHRLAMAFAVLGCVVGDTVIDAAECVNKTFPQFWDVLRRLGGNVSDLRRSL